MRTTIFCLFSLLGLSGCATDVSPPILDNFEELNTATVIASPDPVAGNYLPADRDLIDRGGYLIELLGCGSCHTDGAFNGSPDMARALAGSSTGIAFSNPLGSERPGIVYPANITPDADTGIGNWTDLQIANAIRVGKGRHGTRRIPTMPWPAYSQLSDDDVDAMVGYLRSIAAVSNEVPAEVAPGQEAREPFVYFGVYRSTD